MALYKDGKVYRTLEQQVGHLTEEHDAQVEINEELENSVSDLEATVAVLPTKEYVDNADSLKADKTYVDEEFAKTVKIEGEQTITGTKKFDNQIIVSKPGNNDIKIINPGGNNIDFSNASGSIFTMTSNNFRPYTNNNKDLGSASNKWNNLYVNGNITDGTNNIKVSEITNKLDKNSTVTTQDQVYIKDRNGTQGMLNINTSASPYTVPLRTNTGTLNVSSPTADSMAANKKYVDDGLATKRGLVTGGDGVEKVYVAHPDGTQGSIAAQSTNVIDTIVKRDANGRFQASYPSNDNDVATKKYVDDNAGGGGGGTAKYHHRVNGYVALTVEGSDFACAISLDFYNNVSTAYTSLSDVVSALITAGYTLDIQTQKPNKICNGYIWNKGNSFSDFTCFINITALNYNGNNYLTAADIHGSAYDLALFSVPTQSADAFITDDVISLLG